MLTLKKLLKMHKDDVVSDICSTADVLKPSSWLWLPEQGCKNKSICIVAHVDTVWDHEWHNRKLHYRNGIFTAAGGLGADDRAGVFAALELRKRTGCMVLLTDGEERGGIGAYEAAEEMSRYFSNALLFVEIDRRGCSEMVFYHDAPRGIKDYFAGMGFVEKSGTFSDIAVLTPMTGIPSVNLSAGFFNEHFLSEYLVVPYLFETIDRLEQCLLSKQVTFVTTAVEGFKGSYCA